MFKNIFKVLILSVAAFVTAQIVYAQTASILPPAKTTFFDSNGKPLANGKIDFYIPGTTTRKMTWQDAGETIPNTNPVVLDTAGRAIILGDGSYRQRVTDKNGNLIWDQITSSTGSGGGGGSATVGDGDAVGTIKVWSGFIAPNQYVFAYGQEFVRTSYPELFAAITSQQNVSCTSGSPTLTGLSDTSQLSIGTPIETSCLNSGATIISKTTSTVVASSNAIISTATSARFFPFGNGNGSSTFKLPDLRGYVVAGRDDMGSIPANNLNINGLGATGGTQSQTLVTSNLPPYTPSGTITNGAITTTINPPSLIGGSGSLASAGPGSAQGLVSVTAISTQATSTFSGVAQGGTSTPISIIQPTQIENYIIKVLPDTNPNSYFGVASIGGMYGVIECGFGITCAGNTISAINSTLNPPTPTILGGVFSATCSTSNWFRTLDTTGTFGCSQPSFSDITGTANVAQGGTGKNTFTVNLPLIGNGTGAIAQGTRSGNTTTFATTNGTLTNGNCASIDANGNIIDNGAPCSSGSGANTVFNTVADLTAASVSLSVNNVTTLGYYSIGDGGGTNYVRVGSAPTLACAQTSNSGTSFWDLPDRSSINVKWCGAYGDGTHDDATAITNAKLALPIVASLHVGNVTFPVGTFNCATTCINMVDESNIRFIGSGNAFSAQNNFTRLAWVGNGTDPLINLDGAQGVSIEHLVLQCPGTTYQGPLVNLTQINGSRATDFIRFYDYRVVCLGSLASTFNMTAFLMQKSIQITFEHGFMSHMAYGFVGAVNNTQYANDIVINDLRMDQYIGQPFAIGGLGWKISNLVIEPPTHVAGQGRAICLTPYGINGLTISAGYFADATDGSGNGYWINFQDDCGFGTPGQAKSVSIVDNTVFNGSLINLYNATGVVIQGVTFNATYPYIVNGSTISNLTMIGNSANTHGGAPSVGPIMSGTPTGASIFDNIDGSGVNRIGITNASNTCSTCIGSYLSNVTTATSITTGTPINVAQIALTAGDWDVSGECILSPDNASTTVTNVLCSYNTTSATIDQTTTGAYGIIRFPASFAPGNGANMTVTLPAKRYNVSTGTTIYLTSQSSFGVSTNRLLGSLTARRVH